MRLELRPTLETDAACEVWLTVKPNVELGDGRPISGNVVDAEFARRLERERDYMKRHCNRITADFNAVAEESCQLQDALGFPCETENAQEKAMERIRDLIATEGELGDAKEQIDKLEAECTRLHGHWHAAEERANVAQAAYTDETQSTAELMAENLRLDKRWKTDNFYFCGMMQLLKEHGIAHGSKDLIAAGRRYEESESQRIAAGTADEKPDGQAENDQRNGAADSGPPQQ